MSIEQSIDKLTAAIEANTAAIVKLGEQQSVFVERVAGLELAPAPVDGRQQQTGKQKAKPEAPAKATKAAPALDRDTVVAKLLQVGKTKGRAALTALLGKYGAARATDLKPGDFDAVMADADAALAE